MVELYTSEIIHNISEVDLVTVLACFNEEKDTDEKISVNELNISEDLKNILGELEKYIKRFEDLVNANNPTNFLKSQANVTPIQAANALANIILPLLSKFINAEKIADRIVNKLINETRNKLKDKGRVEVIGGNIIFTPKNKGNYEVFKSNFERKVNSLKQTVKVLKQVIETLLTILRIARVALTAYRAYLALNQNNIKVKAISASTNLQSPSGPYPAAADYILTKEGLTSQSEQLKDKIDKYLLIIKFLTFILGIFRSIVINLKIKLDKLTFTIENIGTAADLVDIVKKSPLEETEEEYNDQYIIRVVKTLSGALQAVAFDKFSKLKITQTAPSKTLTPAQLIDELKRILG